MAITGPVRPWRVPTSASTFLYLGNMMRTLLKLRTWSLVEPISPSSRFLVLFHGCEPLYLSGALSMPPKRQVRLEFAL